MLNRIRNLKSEIQNRRGFSLIELIFAMSFLPIILLGVVSLQTSNLAMMSGNNNRIQAHFYAQQGIQIVRAIGYSAINTNCPLNKPPVTCSMIINQDSVSGDYSLKSGISEKVDTIPFERSIKAEYDGLVNAYKVTAEIEWEDSTGKHLYADEAHVQAKLIVSKK